MFTHLNYTSLSILFIFTLIILNLFWTLRLLHNEKGDCASVLVYSSSNKSALAVPKALPVLGSINCAHRTLTVEPTLSSPSLGNGAGDAKLSQLAFDDVDFNIGRWDNQRLYKFHDSALIGDEFGEASADSLVCLATQSSVERLHSLAQVARQWSGPISVAVFLAGSEELAILQYYITYMRLCFASVRNNVSFHLAIPRDQQPKHGQVRLGSLAERFDCQYPEQTLRRLLHLRTVDGKRWRTKNEYPQNHMRNLARKGCPSKNVFLTDIDIIPSSNMVPLLNEFLRSASCPSRCAYVIPTFEIDVRAKFPVSKAELLRLTKKGLARPFHEKVFIYNQYATNFSSWLSNSRSDSAVFVSHTVTNFEFLYEPFYVSLDNVPVHDERFIGYGFTRNSQVYEMYVAGYSFYVLSPVFTCHWGLQQKKTRPAWREQQNNMNRKRFEKFKTEIFSRYKNDPLLMFSKGNKRKT